MFAYLFKVWDIASQGLVRLVRCTLWFMRWLCCLERNGGETVSAGTNADIRTVGQVPDLYAKQWWDVCYPICIRK